MIYENTYYHVALQQIFFRLKGKLCNNLPVVVYACINHQPASSKYLGTVSSHSKLRWENSLYHVILYIVMSFNKMFFNVLEIVLIFERTETKSYNNDIYLQLYKTDTVVEIDSAAA